MKVVFNVRDLNAGGAERVAILLAHGMQALGHQITIASCRVKAGELKRFQHLKIVDLKVDKPIQEARPLAALVEQLQPDAVLAFGVNTAIGAALSKRLWKTPTVLIFRNENNLTEEWGRSKKHNRFIGPMLSRWAARRAHVVAVSHSLARATATYLRIPPARVTTILNPVIDDTKASGSNGIDVLHPWLKDHSVPAFVAMGRLEYQKGFDVLIDAFAKLRQHAHARLVIFGQGSLQEALQQQIDTLGLCDAIILAGHTDHPMAQMQAAHSFVLSSRFEGFGLVLVEALHAGTRVIATNCDYGPAEVLEDGRYGTLVPVGDATALADAMLASLQNRNTNQQPPEAWFAQFTATEAARQHIALIESLMAQRKT